MNSKVSPNWSLVVHGGAGQIKRDRITPNQDADSRAALTRALAHRGDRLAWLAILRAPWCGLKLADLHALSIAAIGTGGGWVVNQWTLTHADPAIRGKAREFIRGMIDLAGGLDAPAIIGSMQGRWDGGVSREQALRWLGEALDDLGEHAARHGVPLLYEPLNRYETNLCNRLGDTAAFLRSLRTKNVRILADLFHMNLEERDLAGALRDAGPLVGHVHFADSNRQAIGLGHTDIAPVIGALREIGYVGYLSAEILPLPDSLTAARQTIESFRRVL